MNKLKKLPVFKDKAQESDFWDKNDVTEYFDMEKARSVRFPNLKKNNKEYIFTITS